MSGIVQSSRHLPAGSVNTLVLTHMLLCTAHLWGTELPPLPQVPYLAASAGFPAKLTCCGGRSHTRCCTWSHRCRRLAAGSLGRPPRGSHPCRCCWNTGCSQPVKAAQHQPQGQLLPRKDKPHSLPPPAAVPTAPAGRKPRGIILNLLKLSRAGKLLYRSF